MLTFTRYRFTLRLLCGSQSFLYRPLPRALPALLQYYCTSIAQDTTPPPTLSLYAIHYTILVMAISCKGQVGRRYNFCGVLHTRAAPTQPTTAGLWLWAPFSCIAAAAVTSSATHGGVAPRAPAANGRSTGTGARALAGASVSLAAGCRYRSGSGCCCCLLVAGCWLLKKGEGVCVACCCGVSKKITWYL